MILMIDNYDSFVYNLAHLFETKGECVTLYRNDAITPEDIHHLKPKQIVISPGPCTPAEAGISCEVIRTFSGHIPLLGVCLGHQCIGSMFGGQVKRDSSPVHGKSSSISHKGYGLFEGLPPSFPVGRYHSLIIDKVSEDSDLIVTARREEDGGIMALQHKTHPTYGVQFHPESILTLYGSEIADNFLKHSQEFYIKKN